MVKVKVDTWLCNCNELAFVVVLVEGVNTMTNLFISIDMGDLGVGNEDISMEKSLFAEIVTPEGIEKPNLVLTTLAVKVVLTPPTTISPSIGKSLKLSKPYGKVTNI